MMGKTWKSSQRPTSATHAARLCKECAAVKLNLSVERIADLMGVTHDSLYKWLATGRMPLILIPAFELACGCNYVSEWLAASSGKVVISLPKGRTATPTDMVEFNSGFAAALQLLADFHNSPAKVDATEVLAALTSHIQQVAWHRANVAQHANPELDF